MVQKNSVNNTAKERILVVAGPTGIGKSAYGIDIAKKYNGEIVSADSVQIYKELDIGSGKVLPHEMQGIPHHLLDIVYPYEQFTVVDFIKKAQSTITDIIARNKLPIIVGGTGFYLNALLHGYNCGNSGPDFALREKLKELEKINGEGYLYDKLVGIEPSSCIMRNDLVRTIRALEIQLKPQFDANNASSDYDDIYDALFILMDADRKRLDEMAEVRIRSMIDNGLIDEVKRLRRYYETRVFNSVGYREIKYYVKNLDTVTIEETIDAMKQSYHALIKKQQTFFKWIKWDNKVIAYNGDRLVSDNAVKKFMELV